MTTVLVNDCPPEALRVLMDILQGSATIIEEPFSEEKELTGYDLIILYYNGEDDQSILPKIKNLQLRTKFRNIPIILLKEKAEQFTEQPYINFGISEFMAMDDPPPVFRQILQGYLNPSRQPLEEELVYLEPFIESTQRVFSKMAGMDAEFKGIYFKNNLRILGDVSGIIGLSGRTEGTVVITFRWDLAKKVVSKVMRVKETEINAEAIHDGVGEIINMISGAAKKTLCKLSCNFQLSIPTIIVGWGHEAGYPDNATIAVLLFDVGDQSFVLHVSLAS